MQRKRPGAELIVSDWRPLKIPKKYKDGHDEINWDGGRITEGEKVPVHCGVECELLPSADPKEYPDNFRCPKCRLVLAESEIEWKRIDATEKV